ncbi:hypothetical protein HAZT_HAZT008913 [Hyalella azteca]|uniref:Bestrophin homolog n=1 Tax=Hyalella azteca TaxID=294128 RepID=A0A6A0H5H3_HYAAZ|nr:hypothetical protein HAZT_HAZT008913 [Hyalella azteca]
MRYVNLSFTITLSLISPRIKKRFPTMQHLVEMGTSSTVGAILGYCSVEEGTSGCLEGSATLTVLQNPLSYSSVVPPGLLTEQELMIFEILNAKNTNPKYWLPLVWAGAIVAKARKQGRIRDDFAQKTIMDEINNFRKNCLLLLTYDSISVPLVYTQVVTLAVYTFAICTIMGRQFLDPSRGLKGNSVDMYVPTFTILQFFFYMGWLKVAESLINPFGEDDDDFDTNYLVDRNVQGAYVIVDEMHEEHPELIKDMYFEDGVPAALPYTIASEHFRSNQAVNHGEYHQLRFIH